MPDLKATLERALNGTVTLKQGEKEQTVSKAEAGIVRLVNAFAAGDRHARRDLIDLAQRLGVDLVGSRNGSQRDGAADPRFRPKTKPYWTIF